MLPKYSFRNRVKKGFTVSERRTSLKDDKTQIIMLSNPIFKDGKCVGIISAVIELKGFARAFHSIQQMHLQKIYARVKKQE